jgi:hypothetical protein
VSLRLIFLCEDVGHGGNEVLLGWLAGCLVSLLSHLHRLTFLILPSCFFRTSERFYLLPRPFFFFLSI